jgi:hypothetical protein
MMKNVLLVLVVCLSACWLVSFYLPHGAADFRGRWPLQSKEW